VSAAPAVVAIAVVVFAVASKRLGRSPVTGTMLFTALGLVLGPELSGVVDATGLLGQSEFVSAVLTATLVVVLFTDASAINSSNWRDDIIPARLLGIGLPVSIGLGWLLALLLLGDLEVLEAAVLATMLAPTDAALGKAVVSNERVPERIRQALNIESGLNDGISLPLFVVLLAAALAVEESLAATDIVVELVQQVGIALVVGVVVGYLGAIAITYGRRHDLSLSYWSQIAVLALAAAAYTVATPAGGSGFIAAWIAGFVFGRRYDSTADETLPEFAESTGELLTVGSFFVFGVYLGPALAGLTWQIALFGVLSLAVVRVAAVAVALIGAGLRLPTIAYIGWFGPRGLATIILTIEVVGEGELLGRNTIADAALFAVGLSVVLHGATAWRGSNVYADWVETHPSRHDMAERAAATSVVRVPMRSRDTSRMSRRSSG
jgi:NhaP-type Na+/H+ or K+/H+ antiporter